MKPTVLVECLAQSAASVEEQFNNAVRTLSLSDDFGRAKAVFIKPNLTYPSYRKWVTTQKAFMGHLIASLRKINTTTKIYIGESEGGYTNFSAPQSLLHEKDHALFQEPIGVFIRHDAT